MHLQEGVNQFQLAPGCRTALCYHYLFSDNSISSDSGFKHITLRGESMLDIPQVSPDSLRNIMAYMKEEGLHHPTVNDIIETHDHLVTINSRTSLISSIIAWTTIDLILTIILISIFYLYSHLPIIITYSYKYFNSKLITPSNKYFQILFNTLKTMQEPLFKTSAIPTLPLIIYRTPN